MNKTIHLSYPISVNGQEILELTMRRPRVKDTLIHEKQFQGPKQGTLESDIAMFARLCEVAPKDLESLDMSDLVKFQEVFQGFFSSTASLSDEPV